VTIQAYNVRETCIRIFAVNNMPDLRPEDSTFRSGKMRPHTVEITYERADNRSWKIHQVQVEGYRVRKNGERGIPSWKVFYHASDFLEKSGSTIPAWLKTWVLQQAI